ncbi:hypothetical protein ABC977_03735 [Thioalkalicoccus limnaeus]|uniref:Uncharacterized protein n=1 Tax=Thioalkalicoccus limnaeus TaxID=120681 RepID=A0ABV4BAN6_9GAMM
MKKIGLMLLLFLSLASSAVWARIPATPVMTLYEFNGPREIPYYRIESFARDGAVNPAGALAQGSSVIPCLVIRDGRPLTDASGTPFVGFEVVIDARHATAAATERFREAVAAQRGRLVANHHCGPDARYVIDVRKLYALNKAPFFAPVAGRSAGTPRATAGTELDQIVRTFHHSPHCDRANHELMGRRQALERAWDAFIAEHRSRWAQETLARAKHLDYAMRTAIFEGHLDRGCSAYGACERNVIVLSIRNRARGQCLSRQGCRFPGDFQGASSSVSQYNIWDEFLTQVSGLTACFLREDLSAGSDARAGYYRRLQAIYGQSVGDAERILYGSDQDLREVFPGVPLNDLASLRHYYHPPAMGKCFPHHDRVEYMSGAVARKGSDFALIANTRIQVGHKTAGGYPFQEFLFEQVGDRDRVSLQDNYPGFIVDERKVQLRGSSGCAPYGTPSGCGFREVGRYRRTPPWLTAGRPLTLTCQIRDRGEDCQGAPRAATAQVGGVCDIEMQPVAGVH